MANVSRPWAMIASAARRLQGKWTMIFPRWMSGSQDPVRLNRRQRIQGRIS